MFNVSPFESRTVSWWYDQKKKIDFNPQYQRKGNIWTIADKSYLIDSILNDFDIPKIYVADYSFGNAKLIAESYRFAVVDGKQRFEAMFDFYEDKIALDSKFVYEEDSDVKIGGMRFSEIRLKYPEIARKFENYNLSVMRIVTNEEGKINDLFVRLNRSRPLTGAELRAAMNGEVPKIIKNLAEKPFFELVKFSKNRAQDQNAAAKLLLIEFLGGFTGTAKSNLDELVELAVRSESDLAGIRDAKKRVESVLEKMNMIFVNNDPLLSSQGPIPIYYWLIKNARESEIAFVRNFLVNFEATRKQVRSSDDMPDDSKLREYYIYNTQLRSVDNKGSLEIRYTILSEKFQKYLLENNLILDK